MNISAKLQKEIDKHVPKKEQKAFIERAVSDQLKKHIAMNAEVVELYSDGGSRGNPGPSGGGYVIYRGGEEVGRGSHFYGPMTNNQAEYLALRDGLRDAFDHFPDLGVHCFMDSELVVKQMQGHYKVKNQQLRSIYEEVNRIVEQFKSFKIAHVRREQNTVADMLANEAMDRGR